jgi:hypothetical protein
MLVLADGPVARVGKSQAAAEPLGPGAHSVREALPETVGPSALAEPQVLPAPQAQAARAVQSLMVA